MVGSTEQSELDANEFDGTRSDGSGDLDIPYEPQNSEFDRSQ